MPTPDNVVVGVVVVAVYGPKTVGPLAMRCVFCIVLVWASCLQQTQCANPYHGAMSTPFERMVHHDDDFRDAFPFSMSEEVHRRVLHLRNLLLLHDTDFDAVRGTRPVSQRSETCSVFYVCPVLTDLLDRLKTITHFGDVIM